MIALTQSFRVVHGRLAVPHKAPESPVTSDRVEPAPRMPAVVVRLKPPHQVSVSPPTRTKGKWTTQENDRLAEAVLVSKRSSPCIRWKDVAVAVQTRVARQCSYHWSHRLDPDRSAATPTRKKRSVADAILTDQGTRNASRADHIGDIDIDASGDDVKTSFDAAFAEAIGEVCEDAYPSEQPTRRKRRLDFAPSVANCDFSVTNSGEILKLINSIDVVTPQPGLTIRVVPKVTYVSSGRGFAFPSLNSNDRFAFKNLLAHINRRMARR